MEQIMKFIKPEMLVIIPVLYFVGIGLKKWGKFKDNLIPIVLGACGVVLSAIWVLATSDIAGPQSIALGVFTAIVQGILCAGCSVYANQVYKQAKSK